MNCLNCNKELISTGNNPKRYCSDSCRKAFTRKNADIAIQPAKDAILSAVNARITAQPGQIELGQSNPDTQPGQITDRPANYGQPDCQCKHCQQVQTNKSNAILNHNGYISASELIANGYTHNRVSLPGDIDYVGVCSQEVA